MGPADGDWTGRATGLSFPSARCVRERAHVVRDVGREHSAQSGLVRDDNVIQALAPDRADDALDVGVLPRRARRRADALDVHARDGGGDRGERAIPIMQEIAGRLVLREGVPKLLGGPGRRGMLGDRHMHDAATVVSQEDEHEQEPKGHGRYDKQGGHNLAGMVGEEGAPRLGRWARVPSHVRGDGRMTDRDSQLLELAVDSRRTPEGIRGGQLTDQGAHVEWDAWAPSTLSTPPRPEQTESAPVPGDHGLWLDDVHRRSPAMPCS